MSKSNFDNSFRETVGHEGALSMDRLDKGNWSSGEIGVGELKGTKYGVSAAAYPKLDIKNLTLKDAKSIYKKDYWDKVRGDELPTGLDFMVFDAAVNHGVTTATKLLQKSVEVKDDGKIGPVTLTAVKNYDSYRLLQEYMARRHVYWAEISTFDRYGLGWSRRGVKVLLEGVSMYKQQYG